VSILYSYLLSHRRAVGGVLPLQTDGPEGQWAYPATGSTTAVLCIALRLCLTDAARYEKGPLPKYDPISKKGLGGDDGLVDALRLPLTRDK